MGERHEQALDELCLRVGRWWSAERPEEVYSGYIFKRESGIELRLGVESLRLDHHLTERTTPVAAFWGKVGGKFISAFDSVVAQGSFSTFLDSDVAHSFVLQPQLLLIGDRHVSQRQSFSGISFRTNEVHKIFRLHPLKDFEPNRDVETIVLRDGARVSAEQILSSRHALIELPNLNAFECELVDLPGKISYQYAAQRNWNRVSGPSLSYAPRLHLELSTGGSVYRLMRKARHAAQLLSLVSVTPNYLSDFDVYILNDDRPESFRLHKCSSSNVRTESELSDFQVLLGYPRYATEYNMLWNTWFSSMERHLVPRWIFQSTLEQENRFDINRFLNVMQCLEILTNIYSTKVKVDRSVLEQFVSELGRLVAGRNEEADLRFLIAKMKEANRPPLAERLEVLASKVDEQVLRWLLGDWRSTLKLAAQARNYFTHFGAIKDSRREFYEENLATLTCKMTALYGLIEFQLMGFAPQRLLKEAGMPWILQSATHKQFAPQ